MTDEDVAGAMGGPGAGRVGGDCAVEHVAVGDIDDQHQVLAAQQAVSTVTKSPATTPGERRN